MSLAPLSNEHYWEIKNNHEHGTMGPWVFISTHESSWHNSTILMSACECSYTHLSGYENSWALLTGHEGWTVSLNNEQKCWVLKWPTCSILTISHSIFHRKIKNWIFLKSTRNGLLKNVQYGISRPLGSREIQKTKVAPVLLDTL